MQTFLPLRILSFSLTRSPTPAAPHSRSPYASNPIKRPHQKKESLIDCWLHVAVRAIDKHAAAAAAGGCRRGPAAPAAAADGRARSGVLPDAQQMYAAARN